MLKDAKLSPYDTELVSRIYQSKESPRHKELKQKIGDLLAQVKGVTNVHIDDRFIVRDHGKRKPDVWCQYQGKDLIFEIQLSPLSPRYIFNRYDFYRKEKMYLIWILDDFDVHGQSQTERDIKYLTEFQNFFKLDENSSQFRLLCDYKYPFLTDKNRLLTKWLSKSVSLSQVKFSETYYQIYYYNFEQNLKKKEREQERIQEQIEKEREEEEERQRLEEAEQKVGLILYRLREKWLREAVVYDDIQESLNDLDWEEREVLNSSEAFQPKGKEPRLHYWFSIAKKGHLHFLDFMLSSTQIWLDANVKSSQGFSVMKTLFENEHLPHKLYLTRKLLKGGYTFLNSDESLIGSLDIPEKEKASTIILCHLSNELRSSYRVNQLFQHRNLFCTLESAKRGKVVGFGFKPDQWISFANNAIHSYKEYWDYIEIAFRHFGIWEKLIQLDRKGTFQKKLRQYYDEKPAQNYDCDPLFFELYPELIE